MDPAQAPCLEAPLEDYLRGVARGLWALGPGRRRELIRTLRADLLDLAEDRGFLDAKAFEAYLREQPSPGAVARTLQREELDQAYWRVLAALLPMFLAGLWAVVSSPDGPFITPLWLLRQAVWYGSLTYLHFTLRATWARQGEGMRLLWGLLLGGAGGLVWFGLHPLNLWSEFAAADSYLQDFYILAGTWVLMGAFIGFTVERVVDRRRWWVLAVDAPLYFLLTLAHVTNAGHLARQVVPSPSAVQSGKALPRPWRMPQVPTKPRPSRFIPLAIGLQAVLWAGARSSRRLGLYRLFRPGGPSGGGPLPV